ncbi:MAG TPA: hypothetical protein PLV13_05570, partial [Ilumatobacteraceae bacterium]|nr:hypothetical protein [Ilumatobacteraceae bacterium]
MADDEEIDVDGDGRPDVRVPGLGGAPIGELHAGRGDTEIYEAMVDSDPPPVSSPYSPMGRIDQMGYAMRSRTARTGWRRVIILASGWLLLAAVVISLI